MLFRFPGISLAFYASFRHPFWFLLVYVSAFVFVYGFVFVCRAILSFVVCLRSRFLSRPIRACRCYMLAFYFYCFCLGCCSWGQPGRERLLELHRVDGVALEVLRLLVELTRGHTKKRQC